MYVEYIHYRALKANSHFVVLSREWQSLVCDSPGHKQSLCSLIRYSLCWCEGHMSIHCNKHWERPGASRLLLDADKGRTSARSPKDPRAQPAPRAWPAFTDWFQFINSLWTSHRLPDRSGLSPATARPRAASLLLGNWAGLGVPCQTHRGLPHNERCANAVHFSRQTWKSRSTRRQFQLQRPLHREPASLSSPRLGEF